MLYSSSVIAEISRVVEIFYSLRAAPDLVFRYMKIYYAVMNIFMDQVITLFPDFTSRLFMAGGSHGSVRFCKRSCSLL
jgi:hypothetical protein